ncbi:type II CRISPR RNA-guided endonuclease Cas9 [Secundilactobacillus silagei]|uniref:type II CRISPR RNA-guided endonuclease Cas9 n=1 Tax=Secundilactobacillus silagei TaxID=1293415 RepID=UPI0034E280ED
MQGFINRQLVDTRQIIKYAVEILANKYPNTEIVTIKADLNHQFRQNYHLYKNREVNDYHHGFDAYLSGFIGQYLLKTYPKLRGYLVYGDYSKKISDDFHLKNLLSGFF